MAYVNLRRILSLSTNLYSQCVLVLQSTHIDCPHVVVDSCWSCFCSTTPGMAETRGGGAEGRTLLQILVRKKAPLGSITIFLDLAPFSMIRNLNSMGRIFIRSDQKRF